MIFVSFRLFIPLKFFSTLINVATRFQNSRKLLDLRLQKFFVGQFCFVIGDQSGRNISRQRVFDHRVVFAFAQ